MRVIALSIALTGLTACGVTKQVKFNGSDQPTAPVAKPAAPAATLPVMTLPPLPSVSTAAEPTPTLAEAQAPAAVVIEVPAADAKAATNGADERLKAVLVDYRAEVESLLGLIWAKPLPEVTDAGTLTGYVYALDRLMKTNAKIQKVPHLTEADQKMLVEGVEVMQNVRASLVSRRDELAKTP